MTIDIEKERLEFETQTGIKECYDLTGFYAEGEWAYNDKTSNCAFFDGWLAAKRASVGSVEAVTSEQMDEGLRLHGLVVDKASQLSDGFRAGVRYSERLRSTPPSADAKDTGRLIELIERMGEERDMREWKLMNITLSEALEFIRPIAAKEPK